MGLPIPIVGVRNIVRSSRNIITAIVSRGRDPVIGTEMCMSMHYSTVVNQLL